MSMTLTIDKTCDSCGRHENPEGEYVPIQHVKSVYVSIGQFRHSFDIDMYLCENCATAATQRMELAFKTFMRLVDFV